eukprot:scaffold80294_cov59-Phaeocystis_antarctica.AAC.5
MRRRVLPRHCMPPRSRVCRRSGIDGCSGLSHRKAARAPPPAQPLTGRTHLTVGREGASLAVRPVARRPSGAVLATFASFGGGSSAGPRWHGLARRGSWHGLATCDGVAVPIVPTCRAPVSLLHPPMWQWAKMAEVFAAMVAAARVVAATVVAAIGAVATVGVAGRAA